MNEIERLWSRFRGSWMWNRLKRVHLLRTGVHLAIHLPAAITETNDTSLDVVDRDFQLRRDPWNYRESLLEKRRFQCQLDALDSVAQDRRFETALEIGCAEGEFTELLSPRCTRLLAVDLSPTALARARSRVGLDTVEFRELNVLSDPLPGRYDLIVATGVLEYFVRRSTLARVREKLVEGLRPQGLLLVESTRQAPLVENAVWGRYLVRGARINRFVSEHASLNEVTSCVTEEFAITLLRKADGGSTTPENSPRL